MFCFLLHRFDTLEKSFFLVFSKCGEASLEERDKDDNTYDGMETGCLQAHTPAHSADSNTTNDASTARRAVEAIHLTTQRDSSKQTTKHTHAEVVHIRRIGKKEKN